MTDQLLRGKKGLIFGALDESSIAWYVAKKVVEEGAAITLTNSPQGISRNKINELAKQCNAEVIPADATSIDDLTGLFHRTMEVHEGQIDFILHSIAQSSNVKNGKPYTNLDYTFFMKTLDVSAISFHKIMHVAYQLSAIKEWGSILALTYNGAQRILPTYSDMGDAKATLESIARSFGYYFGIRNKVRVNTISQSPTKTMAASGLESFDIYYRYANVAAPLGNATAEDCANYCVTLFSDYTRMVTMQNLYHDGGFSNTGISDQVMEMFRESSKKLG